MSGRTVHYGRQAAFLKVISSLLGENENESESSKARIRRTIGEGCFPQLKRARNLRFPQYPQIWVPMKAFFPTAEGRRPDLPLSRVACFDLQNDGCAPPPLGRRE